MFPALEIPVLFVFSPLECSPGASPKNAAYVFPFAKRLKSPLSSGIGKKYLDTIIKRLAGLYTDREDIVNRFALLSGIVGRFRRAFVQMMKQ